MNRSGIYCIENLKNGKIYIGQAINLEKRNRRHFRELKNNYHYNKYLQNSYNKYGDNFFVFYVLIYCEPFELTRYEQFFVNLYSSDILYNIRTECVSSSLGTFHTEETKTKMSNSQKGKVFSEEAKENMSKAHLGRKLSETTKEKMSISRIGKNHTEETKEKISQANSGEKHYLYGKSHTQEAKRKMSQAHLGEKHHMYNKKHSEQTLEKMRKIKEGENNPNSKLTKEKVFWIKENKDNYTGAELSKMFNVSKSQIYRIINNKSWKEKESGNT